MRAVRARAQERERVQTLQAAEREVQYKQTMAWYKTQSTHEPMPHCFQGQHWTKSNNLVKCRAYLESATKRLARSEEALAKAKAARDAIQLDIEDHLEKLAELEDEEAARQLDASFDSFTVREGDSRVTSVILRPAPRLTFSGIGPRGLGEQAKKRQEIKSQASKSHGSSIYSDRRDRHPRRPTSAPSVRDDASVISKIMEETQPTRSKETHTKLTSRQIEEQIYSHSSARAAGDVARLEVVPSGEKVGPWDWSQHLVWATSAFNRLDQNVDGFIVRRELRLPKFWEVMKELLGDYLLSDDDKLFNTDLLLSFVMRHGDEDGNGGLSFQEFLYVTWKMKSLDKNSELEADLVFVLCDPDENHKLSRTEFPRALKFLNESSISYRGLFPRVDTCSQEDVDGMFNEADANHDGLISRKEYRQWLVAQRSSSRANIANIDN